MSRTPCRRSGQNRSLMTTICLVAVTSALANRRRFRETESLRRQPRIRAAELACAEPNGNRRSSRACFHLPGSSTPLPAIADTRASRLLCRPSATGAQDDQPATSTPRPCEHPRMFLSGRSATYETAEEDIAPLQRESDPVRMRSSSRDARPLRKARRESAPCRVARSALERPRVPSVAPAHGRRSPRPSWSPVFSRCRSSLARPPPGGAWRRWRDAGAGVGSVPCNAATGAAALTALDLGPAGADPPITTRHAALFAGFGVVSVSSRSLGRRRCHHPFDIEHIPCSLNAYGPAGNQSEDLDQLAGPVRG